MPITQTHFAGALGLSGVHVNRVLKQLDRDGVVTKSRTEITIHEVERLSQIAFGESSTKAA
jgi:CRP-like cAMP-binding protein